MKDLGIINSWKAEPTQYTDHKESCGRDHQYKHYLGNPGTFEMRTVRVYDHVTTTTLGSCYTKSTCNKCGCTWKTDSSN